MIASRRTTTETPTRRNGSANSGRSDRMLSPRPTRTPRARRAPRRHQVTGPGRVSQPDRQQPGACDGDRRRSAVAVTRVPIAVPGAWLRGLGRRVRTSSGTSDRGRQCDRHAGRRRGAIPGTPTPVPGMTTRQNLDGQGGIPSSHPRVSHRSNGGRQRITARRRGLCTCCGVVTAGCSTRTGLAGAMVTFRLIVGRRDRMASAGGMSTFRLIVGRRDRMASAGAMVTFRLIVGRRDRMASAGGMSTFRLIVERQDPMAPTVATKDLRGESVHSRVASRSRARGPAVISPATGTGLTGPVCRRAGSRAAARPKPTGPDPAQASGLASAQRLTSACLSSGTPGRRGRMWPCGRTLPRCLVWIRGRARFVGRVQESCRVLRPSSMVGRRSAMVCRGSVTVYRGSGLRGRMRRCGRPPTRCPRCVPGRARFVGRVQESCRARRRSEMVGRGSAMACRGSAMVCRGSVLRGRMRRCGRPPTRCPR
jgi:hypothetical protein